MAMEYRQSILDAHNKTIIAIQYNPFRREIYTAGEDALIKVWEVESGKLLNTWTGHVGWITALLYCKEIKMLFSCSIDGNLIAWGPSGKMIQRVQTGNPIYCMAYNSRHHQILMGHNKKVRLFQLVNPEESHAATEVLEKKSVTCSEHADVVSCIISCEGRFYSAGFDKKMLIYDVPHHGDLRLNVSGSIVNAHEAAISCMIFAKDADNSWIITGSFDRVVKLWSLDGNLLQKFDGFLDTITSIIYVVPTQTLWITANSPTLIVYDPRSGINVSDFIQTHDGRLRHERGEFFKQLLFVPESNEIIGTTSRRSIATWRYNPVAPCTILPGHADIVECLCYTAKEPILIFSGGDDGLIRKWERMQLNSFMYSQETLALSREDKPESVRSTLQEESHQQKRKGYIALFKKIRNGPLSADDLPKAPLKSRSDTKVTTKAARPGVSSLYYFEEMDVLISGYEDSRIWGYNEETEGLSLEDAKELDQQDPNGQSSDQVSNRVSGMSLKHTFMEHKDVVTGFACIIQDNHYWMVSTGWDRRLCIYDLKAQKLNSVFSNRENGYGKEELAADGIILDIEYCPGRNEIAYASADKQAYIRRFSPKGDEMTLLKVLQGHEAEVTRIKWHRKEHVWITGSEDRTLRIWAGDGIAALRVINNEGPVTALAVDEINGCIISGSQDKIIRIFDMDRKDEVVQKNHGHSDEIRSIIHIPARNQYVSASWDNTVRVWNAYFKKGQRRIAIKASANAATHTFYDLDETAPTYADLNPLVVPKMLAKGIFIKDVTQERPVEEEETQQMEQSKLEEDLRTTLNDLELALNTPDVTFYQESHLQKKMPSKKSKMRGMLVDKKTDARRKTKS